ncbi:MAG: glycoside hydrolase [Streptosporangiaceae bacterium]|nr:glycoside hydrolase [Streptosporangiaceae bacterium]
MRITGVESTSLFRGTAQRPLQIVRVTIVNDGPSAVASAAVTIGGPGAGTTAPFSITDLDPGQQRTAEVPVEVAAHCQPGTVRPVTVIAEKSGPGHGPGNRETVHTRTERQAEVTVAEAGWTMWMVSHFHYDPVWWTTQGQFTEARLVLPDEDGSLPDTRTAFELVQLHLEKARRDPDYKFVLAEIDYLKPHFDAYPQDRADLRRLIADGRVEIVGGTYNEPNTNLTSAESTIRNAVHGAGFQRGVLGADPRSAWMLDAFGHDPGFPGLMAAAGLTSSSWARGPFHQWGPEDNNRMQFASEFEWLSPDGRGLLTSYMTNHYGAGWGLHSGADLAAAEAEAYRQFTLLAEVAATRNVMLPVGADHVIPARWVTDIHRDWNERYLWPRFVTAIPREFFAAVRAEAESRDIWITPQTRDMNPVYTGKDVSYTDTKQAQRAGETAVAEGERLATLAWLGGAPFPAESLDKAWRQLAYGAHHDAITGTESDQVYLDLLSGWREAWERGDSARRAAIAALTGGGGRQAAVVNGLARERNAMATVTVELPEPGTRWLVIRDEAGAEVPALAEGVRRHGDGSLAGVTLTFRAAAVPALGYRSYRLEPSAEPGTPGERSWSDVPGTAIENEAYLVTADPERGGTLSVTDKRSGEAVLRGPGNELLLQDEYDKHPRWGEGPWHLSPRGPGRGSAAAPARVRAQRSPAGSRLMAEFSLGDLAITQETVLWDGAERVEFRTHVSGSIGKDRLLRVRFPAGVPGALPLYQTATAVIGRPFGAPEADTARHWYTLDNPANQWFGLGSAARVELEVSGRGRLRQAIGVAEVIPPLQPNGHRNLVRDVITALAAAGVTATCSRADGSRYGSVDTDSNLPDVRIALGGPADNPFTAEVLAAADPSHAKRLAALLADGDTARLWVPAARSREDAFAPGADLRGARDLPVLIVAGGDPAALAAALAGLADDMADAEIGASAAAPTAAGDDVYEAPLADRSVALFNQGTPGGVIAPDGTLYLSLMRACSSWPCGVWIDGDRRPTPDGGSFAWQHWSHTFEYALASGPGDWRRAGYNAAAEDYNHGLLTAGTFAADEPGAAAPSAAGVPSGTSLASAEPRNVTLTALKPHGNPLASSRPGTPREGTVTVRLRETDGTPVRAAVRLAAGIRAAWLSDLLEESAGAPVAVSDGAAFVDVPAFGTVTLVLQVEGGLGMSSPGSLRTPGGNTPQPAVPEAVQPVYTRYWLHGKGPAPAGNLPVAVHVSPTRVAVARAALALAASAAASSDAPASAETAVVRVSVACGPQGAAGELELVVPEGIAAEAEGVLRYDLGPGEFAAWDVTVRAVPGAADGRYFLGARVRDGLGQVLEDTAMVAIGEPGKPNSRLPAEELFVRLQEDLRTQAGEVSLTVLTPELRLAPGEQGALRVRITSRLASELRGEAQLLSPFGSWTAVDPWIQDVRADPGGSATLSYPVTAPATAQPGQHWWLLVKLMYFGRVLYSEAVPLAIR